MGGKSKKCYLEKEILTPSPLGREKVDPLEIKSKISYLSKKQHPTLANG